MIFARVLQERTSQLARNSLRFKAPMSSDLSSAENFEHLGAHKRSLMNWMNLNELRSVRSTCSPLRRTRFEAASGDLIHCGMSISLFIIFLISLGRFLASLENARKNRILFFPSPLFFVFSWSQVPDVVVCISSKFVFFSCLEEVENTAGIWITNKSTTKQRVEDALDAIPVLYACAISERWDEASWGPTKQTHTKIH